MSKQAKRDSRHKNFTTFQDFIDVTTKIWDRYLQTIYRFPLELMDGGSLLYPNIALFVETNRYYVLELFGSDEIFKGLTVKKHKEPNIYKYLYQFPIESVSNPAFRFAGVENGLVNLMLSGAKTIEVFENRFGFIRNPKQLTTFRFVNATG